MTGPMESAQFNLAIKAYVLDYISEDGAQDWKNASQVEASEEEFAELYHGYEDVVMWVQDFQRDYTLDQRHRRNPFIEHFETFSETVAFVQEVGHQFGSFQNLECRTLKRQLLAKDLTATGRVLLP